MATRVSSQDVNLNNVEVIKGRGCYKCNKIAAIAGISLITLAALGALAALVIFTAPVALSIAAAILTFATPLSMGLSLGGSFLLGSIFLVAGTYKPQEISSKTSVVLTQSGEQTSGFQPGRVESTPGSTKQAEGTPENIQQPTQAQTQEQLAVASQTPSTPSALTQQLPAKPPVQGGVFQKLVPHTNRTLSLRPEIETAVTGVACIGRNFTSETSIEHQRGAHEEAKKYLKEWLPKVGARVAFISHSMAEVPSVETVRIVQKNLDPKVFSCRTTTGVKEDIRKDSKGPGKVISVYGVASQFNGCEYPTVGIADPGNAVSTYLSDGTQGPQAQLAFSSEQVELINCGGHLGFNALCKVLDDETRTEISSGYFMPSPASAQKSIQQLREHGTHIEYPCIGNKTPGGKHVVYEILVAAPAFNYSRKTPQPKDRNEIEFLCALHAFRAQFQHCIHLAKTNKKPVCLKAVGIGLGVFGNDAKNVAKAFYQAGLEYQKELKNNKVTVEFQLYRGGPQKATPASDVMALVLGLQGYTPPMYEKGAKDIYIPTPGIDFDVT